MDQPGRPVMFPMPRLARQPSARPRSPESVGRPVDPERNPDSEVRNLPFGTAGMVTYLIVEHERRVRHLAGHLAGPG